MVQIHLLNNSLWNEFAGHTNEMIITKSGRCMFPQLKYQFASIDNEDHCYGFALGMLRLDRARWKFRSGAWQVTSRQKFPTPRLLNQTIPIETTWSTSLQDLLPHMQLYEPRESPRLGSELVSKGISFARVKLTNQTNAEFAASRLDIRDSDEQQSDYVFALQSFYRYQPVLILVDINDCMLPPSKLLSVNIDLWINKARTVRIDATQFIAVTHYQNERITAMKKAFNPHAKGFRRKVTKMYDSTFDDDELDTLEYMASRALEKLSCSSTIRIASPPPSFPKFLKQQV